MIFFLLINDFNNGLFSVLFFWLFGKSLCLNLYVLSVVFLIILLFNVFNNVLVFIKEFFV